MSQREVLRILKELDGEAPVGEIRREIKEEFPNRSLDSYVHKRLCSLKKRNLVSDSSSNGKTIWKVTEKGGNYEHQVSRLESADSELLSEIEENRDLTIHNIVATVIIADKLDLDNIASVLSNAEYHSEVDSHMTYKLDDYNSVSLRVPSTGRVTITGAADPNEIYHILDEFCSNLNSIGVETDFATDDVIIQNIVGTADIGQELELDTLAKSFKQEKVEYDPENFPGVIYRPNVHGTISIFRTGKISFSGVKNFSQIPDLLDTLNTEFETRDIFQ